MPYVFDGIDDQISLGSDASIDNYATRSIALWVIKNTLDESQIIWSKDGASNPQMSLLNSAGSNRVRYRHGWTSNGTWISTTGVSSGTRFHICVTYNNGATTNDAAIYINGALETLSTDTNPTGTEVADGANTMFFVENVGTPFDGTAGVFAYDDAIWSAAEVNRAKWWGRPFGGLQVYHPTWTNKTANEGSATAAMTITGALGTSMAIPTVRPGTAMMGMGIGW